MNPPTRACRLAGAALAALSVAAGLTLGGCGPSASASAVAAPAEAATPPGLETAIVSGGCFWGIQGVYEHVKGVKSAVSGYTGGGKLTASYDLVSTGTTGHAESVKITFDPKIVSYGEILRIFFSVATDPTQVNRQDPDEGTQYRSEIWYTSADQQKTAQAYIAKLNASGVFSKPIATRVDPAGGFYPAETYHQDYLVRHPDEPYIATYDLPKVATLQRQFPGDYQAAPTLVLADNS